MPTTYTHDAFGRKVYKSLQGDLQELIHRHIQLYRIGLHGPDILFYYGLRKNYVNQTGVRLHGEIAYPFFEQGIRLVRKNQDDALLVYLLGFACHFMLDSTCHPYIYHIEDQVSHTIIEKEMDRRMMKKDGLDPLTYFPARGIIPSCENAAVIQKMFPELTTRQMERALSGMRRLTGMMVYENEDSYRKKMLFLRITGLKKTFGEHFMTKQADGHCNVWLSVLDDFFAQALEETQKVLEKLYWCSKAELEIPERFRRNYQD